MYGQHFDPLPTGVDRTKKLRSGRAARAASTAKMVAAAAVVTATTRTRQASARTSEPLSQDSSPGHDFYVVFAAADVYLHFFSRKLNMLEVA